ncbi:FRG domain-containing protein [candidate division KSB1 bacterium]|nr:FRG domain-containing protein [candidate division KSB1 bacterium]
MASWNIILDELQQFLNDLNISDPFFRGHTDASWKLKPRLARKLKSNESARGIKTKESRLFGKFMTRGAADIPPSADSWDILVLMQHYGVPTRLLD